MRRRRAAMSPEDVARCSEAIIGRLLSLKQTADAATWFVYVSVGNEVATHELMRRLLADGRQVCVPRTQQRGTMTPVAIRTHDALQPGPMRVPEPPGDLPPMDGPVDVCLVPGLAFTASGHRLGSGAGFYDRWLSLRRHRLAIGLAYAWQVVASLPLEAHDVAVDLVVTEAAVYGAAAPGVRNFPPGSRWSA